MIRPLAALLIFCVCLAATASADEPWGVALTRPDSLVGWEHGGSATQGWQIHDGRLSGSADATRLVSGWTFGDVELRFQWTVADGGQWAVRLLDVPDGKGLELTLRQGDGCGRITDGDKQLAPGTNVGKTGGGMHAATIRREKAKLAVSVDGQPVAEVRVKPGRRFGLALALTRGRGTLADLRAREPAGRPMFNGMDLAGWWTPGKIAAWQFRDGVLARVGGGGNYLRSDQEYGNFTFSCEYKIAKRGNSGIGIRTPRDGWPSSDGMELQIEDRPGITKSATMSVYGNVPPVARADKSEAWNRVVVKAEGYVISAWVNGELVQYCNTFFHPELQHRNLKGWIGVQDHGCKIELRDVSILEAPEGLALDAWYQARTPQATTAMVDRLINPQRLAIDDGIRSGVASRSVPDDNKAEQVLADLKGPGAVVRVAHLDADGKLAFYFDGEQKPRIECKVDGLRGRLPHLTENGNPEVTCLTYEKSLKVVLRESRKGRWQLDYVTFPNGYELNTYVDTTSGFPRGWLGALIYRQNKLRWGAPRSHDPAPRHSSQKRTIKPGKSEKLVEVDGAGYVQWLRLDGPKSLLEGDDLWLEVTVDGEPRPAVSAPVRFWFPALVGQGNFHNPLFVDYGGATTMLAMPFANGLTVSAKNCAKKPVQDVGVTVSWQRPSERDPSRPIPRMRLRGEFLADGEGSDELFTLDGSGRWIGLVCDVPKDKPIGIDALIVDGEPAEDWKAGDLDLLLGRGEDDFRACLSGRHNSLTWRYFLLAPVDFENSLTLKTTTRPRGPRLALYYQKK